MKINLSIGETGLGFMGMLTIAFVVLKLLEKIDWSWAWVLSPLWIPPSLLLLVMLVIFAGAFINEVRLNRVADKRRKEYLRRKN